MQFKLIECEEQLIRVQGEKESLSQEVTVLTERITQEQKQKTLIQVQLQSMDGLQGEKVESLTQKLQK